MVNCRCSFSKTGIHFIIPSFFVNIYTPFKHPTCIVKSHYKGLHIWASYVCFLLKFGSLYTCSWNYFPFMNARPVFLVGCKFCFLYCLVLSCIVYLFVLFLLVIVLPVVFIYDFRLLLWCIHICIHTRDRNIFNIQSPYAIDHSHKQNGSFTNTKFNYPCVCLTFLFSVNGLFLPLHCVFLNHTGTCSLCSSNDYSIIPILIY